MSEIIEIVKNYPHFSHHLAQYGKNDVFAPYITIGLQPNKYGLLVPENSILKPIRIITRLHGDEECAAVGTDLVIASRYKNGSIGLPPLIYQYMASSTAFANNSETNVFGHNLNREFQREPTEHHEHRNPDDEAMLAMLIASQIRTERALTVHADEQHPYPYLYVHAPLKFVEKYRAHLALWQEEMKRAGIKLFTGIDDEKSIILRNWVQDGLCVYDPKQISVLDGTFELALLHGNLSDIVFTLEIPTSTSPELQRKIAQITIDILMLLK